MIKRTVAALLWFYVVWAFWNGAAIATGLSPALGPVIGAALAGLVGADPMHKIWGARRSSNEVGSRGAAPVPQV